MKPFLSFIAIAFIIILASSCANIIPPSGGPRDSLPPHLVTALPKDSAVNVTAKNITLTFDEFVEVKEVQTNLIINPVPKNTPNVDYRLRNVTIKLRDSLEPNTTYSLDFGDAIKDVNEGNPAKNFTYVFSTGKSIANGVFGGKVVLAETGKIDSTLIVVLHRNLNDTAVIKDRIRYYTKLDGKGNFRFKNLEPGNYGAFVLPNSYSKKYDDSTSLFGFLNKPVGIADTTSPVVFYAYQEQKKKPTGPSQSTNNGGDASPGRQGVAKPGAKEDKRLRYTVRLENGQQDLLSNKIQIDFVRKLFSFDSSKILLTDTFNRPVNNYKVTLDTGRKSVFITYNNWRQETHYRILLMKDAVADTNNVTLSKGDTLQFVTKKEADYGSLRLRFNNLDFSRNPVLRFISGETVLQSVPLTSREFYRKLFIPGDYELNVLYDTNKNGVWDAGNYKEKRQPEIVMALKQKFTVKANWDNETDNIVLDQ